ncbi:MAG: hypothetical protein FWG36_02685 [Oscillospiraceae bacterium]|nr:hypothetical protein [Oscillospiraceae bacterium]
MRYTKRYSLILLTVAALLNTGSVMIARAILYVEQNIILCFLTGAAFTMLFYGCVMIYRYTNIWTSIILSAAIPLVVWRFGILSFVREIVEEYSAWIYSYDLMTANPPPFAVTITTIIAAAVSGIYTTIFVVRRPRPITVVPLFLAAVLVPYQWGDPVQLRIGINIILFALLYLIVLSGYDTVSRKMDGKLRAVTYQKLGAALCAVIVLLSNLIPFSVSGRPDIIDSLQEIDAKTIFQNLGSAFETRTLRINTSGEVTLGGANTTKETLLFELETRELIYLYADTYDRYTGSSWLKTDDERVNFTQYDYNERQDALYVRDIGYNLPPFSFNITYDNLVTNRLLVPRQISNINIKSGNNSIFMKDDLTLSLNSTARRGFSYSGTTSKRTLNYAIDMSDNYISGKGDFMFRYLELPDSVTQRTRNLARNITEGAVSSIQKALIIQDYLSQTYYYTLDAPALPEETDFVDFFLFEAKTGYCTSYASAMVVMLRSLGIPARYCEGFTPDPKNGNRGVYSVYATDAHAWVEMYAPFAGWVELDPTGSSSAAFYRSTQIAPEKTVEETDEYPVPLTPTPAPFLTPTPAPVSDIPAAAVYTDEKTANALFFSSIFRFIVIVAIIASPAVIWFFGSRLYIIIRLDNLKRKSASKQARFWYNKILGILKTSGLVIKSHETMREFEERVRETLPLSDLLPAIALMEIMVYNEKAVNTREIRVLASTHRNLADGQSRGWGTIRRLLETHVTLRLLWSK